MTWRDHTWEFTVGALSWIVAIGAIVFVVGYVAFEAIRSRRSARR